MDALDKIKGATSSDSLVRLRGEAQAPFRFTRLILVGSLDAGAIVGLLFIIARLVSALKGARPLVPSACLAMLLAPDRGLVLPWPDASVVASMCH